MEPTLAALSFVPRCRGSYADFGLFLNSSLSFLRVHPASYRWQRMLAVLMLEREPKRVGSLIYLPSAQANVTFKMIVVVVATFRAVPPNPRLS
jgi:hypothetical protein